MCCYTAVAAAAAACYCCSSSCARWQNLLLWFIVSDSRVAFLFIETQSIFDVLPHLQPRFTYNTYHTSSVIAGMRGAKAGVSPPRRSPLFIKSWKTSAVSTTVWMVETQLCKLRGTSDIYTNYHSRVFYVLSLWRIQVGDSPGCCQGQQDDFP